MGSLHCVGMCGGFVAFYSADNTSGEKKVFYLPHLYYHVGRMLSYLAWGGLAGSLGAGINSVAELAGWHSLISWVAGIFMISWGIYLLLLRLGKISAFNWKFLSLGRLFRKLFSKLKERPPIVRAGLLGLFTGLLPCGWLYAFVATAAITASPLKGMAVMFAFWAGSVPALLLLGLGINFISPKIRKYFPWIEVVAILSVGFFTLYSRSQLHLKIPIPSKDSRGTVQAPKCH